MKASVAALLVAIALGGCGGSDKEKSASKTDSSPPAAETTTPSPTVPDFSNDPKPAPKGGGKLPAAYEEDFVRGCVRSGQPAAGCRCIFKALVKRGINTPKEFADLAADIKRGKISPDFRAAALECKDKLDTG